MMHSTASSLVVAPARITIDLDNRTIQIDGHDPRQLDGGIHTLTFYGLAYRVELVGTRASPPLTIREEPHTQGPGGSWLKYN